MGFRWSAFFVLLLAACGHSSPYLKSGTAAGPTDVGRVLHRLLLIGDAGTPLPNDPTLRLATERASAVRTTVVFMGDNVYRRGFPEGTTARGDECGRVTEDGTDAENKMWRLCQQIAVIKKSGAKGFFIPGNHDWDHWGPDGRNAVLRQQRFVDAHLGRESFWPRDACPGPVVRDLAGGPRLIVIDTEWWLHKYDKPGAECTPGTDAGVLAAVERHVATSDRPVVLIGHHPLTSHGPHGGFFGWKDHLFPLRHANKALWLPLPIVGSLGPFLRHMYAHPEDNHSRDERRLRAGMNQILRMRRPLLHAGGHEHSLEVAKPLSGPRFRVVSGVGAGDRATPVRHDEDTLFAHQHMGFVQVDFLADGQVVLFVVEPDMDDGGPGQNVFSTWLLRRFSE